MVCISLTNVNAMLADGINQFFRIYGAKFEWRAMKPTHAVSHGLHGNILPHCFYHRFRTDKILPNCFRMSTRKRNMSQSVYINTFQGYCTVIISLPCRIHIGHCSGFSISRITKPITIFKSGFGSVVIKGETGRLGTFKGDSTH